MTFYKTHFRPLLFSSFQMFFSAPGQTFLIALVVGPIFTELSQSQTKFAGMYSLATILAALFLNPAGRIIDKKPIQTVLAINVISMAVGCWLLALSQSLFQLFVAFFILRFMGQGVFLLTSVTAIGKWFDKNRGKASSILTLGYPLSEMVYPALTLTLMSTVGWRSTYLIFGLGFLCIMWPIQRWLMKGYSRLEPLPGEEVVRTASESPVAHKTLKEAAKDMSFYLIIMGSCIPPILMTGLFFHQTTLFSLHGWPLSWSVYGLGIYAIAKAVVSLLTGPQVDKFGPLPFFMALILCMAIGLWLSSVGGGMGVMMLYFGLMGAALGMSMPTMNVIWPRLYGTKHLGSIRGFVSTFRNGLTSLGPLPIALAIDHGVSLIGLLHITAIIIAILSITPLIVRKLEPSL